jgi:Ca2+-binding RTX toxin-like protein
MKPLTFRGVWLAPLLTVLAAMVAGLVLSAGIALAAPVGEVEPNDSPAEAQNIDGSFSRDFDPNIGDQTTNTSTIIPHATVNGTGNDTVDYYSFTVSQGDKGIFDVDGAALNPPEEEFAGFDSWIELYDSSGQFLDFSDDSSTEWGQGGSVHPFDSYLEYTFQTSGTYYIAVGAWPELQPIPSGTSYQLHVSLGFCHGKAPTIEARSGRTTNGTAGDDVIVGTSGADAINAKGGNDIICGKDGNDRILGDRGDDILLGQGGNDTLDGGIGRDEIDGGDGTDKCSLGEVRRDNCELAIGPNV